MDNLLSIVTFLPLVGALVLFVLLRGEDETANRNAKPDARADGHANHDAVSNTRADGDARAYSNAAPGTPVSWRQPSRCGRARSGAAGRA